MIESDLIITSTKKIKIFGLIILKKKRIVFRVQKDGICYNSTLGDLGMISYKNIVFIHKDMYKSSEVIKMEVNNFATLKFKMNPFRRKLSELYFKEMNAHLIIFPQDVDISLDQLINQLKANYKRYR